MGGPVLPLLLALLVPTVLWGQLPDAPGKRLSVEEGLSSPLVTNVVQDGRGFLWIATQYGMNRYDGTSITQFLNDGTPGCLPDNTVFRILPRGAHQLLLATGSGLVLLDLDDFTFQRAPLTGGGADTQESYVAERLERDYQGNLWVCSSTTVLRLDSNLRVLDRFLTQPDPVANRNRNVFKLIPLPSGEVLFWMYDHSVCYWSPGMRSLLPIGAPYDFLRGSLFTMVGVVDNRYIVHTSGHTLRILDNSTGRRHDLQLPGRMEPTACWTWKDRIAVSNLAKGMRIYSLGNGQEPELELTRSDPQPDADVRGIFADEAAGLWAITADKGLIRLPRMDHRFSHHDLARSTSNEAGPKEVSVIVPHGSRLLVGTYGSGFTDLDPESPLQRTYSVKLDPASENMVWNIRQAAPDTLWIGTQQGLIYHALGSHAQGRLPMAHPTVLDSVAITTLFEDSRHWIWMGLGKGNGVAVYDAPQRKFRHFPFKPDAYPFRYPLHIGEDSLGDLWFTSDVTGNLVRWDQHGQRFHTVLVPGIRGSINRQSGGFFLDGTKNEIWYGVEPMGLVRYRITSGQGTLFDTRNGLGPGRVKGIIMDGQGRLWMGTTQGISCFDPAMETAVNYTMDDGLPFTHYSSQLHYDPSKDRIYAGSAGALTWFQVPSRLFDDRPVPIALTDLMIGNRSVRLRPGTTLVLGPSENNITVKFSGINLTDGDKNRYQYRLNGGEWVDLGTRPEVRFADLSAADYALEARVARRHGHFGPGHLLLRFSVRPYFTETYWFLLLSAGAVFLLVWSWYRYRLLHLRRLERMRAQISRDLHDEIGSRITNINMMSQIIRREPGGGKPAQDLLGKIQEESEEITRSMREIIWNIDPRNDSLAAAMPRMLAYASQLLEPRNIEVRAAIGELESVVLDMARRRDLLLIFKEAVHNIAKHSGATVATIHAQVEDGRFRLRIADNGMGFDRTRAAEGSGLRSMQWRAEAHRWDLHVESTPGSGTTASVTISMD